MIFESFTFKVTPKKICGPELFLVWFQLLHHNVDAVERKPDNQANGGSLTIKCKDFRIIQLDIKEQREYLNIASSIEKLSNIGKDHFNQV